MALGEGHPFADPERGKFFAGVEEMPDFPEDPGMAEGGAADHDPVHPVALESLAGPGGRVDVAVADDGDVHPGIGLDRPDEGPVRLALVHLAAGPAVDGEGGDAGVLQALGQLDDDLGTLVPAETGLDGHRLPDGFDDGPGDGDHLVGILHHAAAGAPAGDFRDRAAEVDVDEVGAVATRDFRGTVGHPGGIDHRLGDAAVDLDADGGFFRGGLHLGDGLDGVADQAVGGDEFGIDEAGTLLFAEDAERGVRDVLHRREQQWPVPYVKIPDFHSSDLQKYEKDGYLCGDNTEIFGYETDSSCFMCDGGGFSSGGRPGNGPDADGTELPGHP